MDPIKDQGSQMQNQPVKDLVLPTKYDVVFDDPRHVFACKKAEKIVSAVHMVTNFIPPSEPIRVRLREKSINVLSDVISIKSEITQSDIRKLEGSLVEIASLLGSAQAAGYVSVMNGNLLRDEVQGLGDFIRKNSESFERGSGAIAESAEEFFVPTPTAEVQQISAPKKAPLPVRRPPQVKKDERPQTVSQPSVRQSDRRGEILKLFELKDKITVRDASDAIKDVGEKTIQRELLALVAEGTLIKEGERRWSTYSLRKRQ